MIGIHINRFESFDTLSPSPKGEGWDEGKARMTELMERLIYLLLPCKTPDSLFLTQLLDLGFLFLTLAKNKALFPLKIKDQSK